MQFYIPEISDEIRLLADWQFNLHNEERNTSLSKFLNVGFPPVNWQTRNDPPVLVVIPAGTILVIDRVYIRKGQSDFSSITFRWKGASNPSYMKERADYSVLIARGTATTPTTYGTRQVKVPKEQIRFWAKLDDVNKIEYEKV